MDNNKEQQGQENKKNDLTNGVSGLNSAVKIIRSLPLIGGIVSLPQAPSSSPSEEVDIAPKIGWFTKLFRGPWAGVGPTLAVIAFIGLIIILLGLGDDGGLSTGGGGNSTTTNTPPSSSKPSLPPIPGLTLTLSAPDFIDNGQNIVYTVSVAYDSNVATTKLDQIIVFEDVPQGATFQAASGIYKYDPNTNKISWSLSEAQNQTQFSFTLNTTQSNFTLSNNVYAQTAASSPPQSSVFTGGVCSEGTGFCTVDNLKKYFNDTTSAQKASIICQRESGGNPGVLNKGCLNGTSEDYSVGLFQINMLAHCPGAFSSFTEQPPYSCTIANQSILDACVAKYQDPVENVGKMVELSAGGTNWAPWRTPTNSCGIN